MRVMEEHESMDLKQPARYRVHMQNIYNSDVYKRQFEVTSVTSHKPLGFSSCLGTNEKQKIHPQGMNF